MANKRKENLLFLSPLLVIKKEHLNKQDVFKIKESLSRKITFVNLIVAVFFAVISLSLSLILSMKSGWKITEVYGNASLLGQQFGFLCSVLCFVFGIISYKVKNKKAAYITRRLSGIFIFLAIAISVLLFFYSDAKMGYISTTESVTPSIILIAILVLVQPVYWTDAILVDLIFDITFFSFASVFNNVYGIKSYFYYVATALVYPIICYLIISILFYGEAQKYCQEQINARLNDTAMYDELTHCKNRYALKQFIQENSRRWENKSVNLLVIMFDIDNFKEFNDQFSHPGGDYCLRSICDAIRKEFPSPSLNFFRYGGEEFLLFFEIDDIAYTTKIVEKVRKAIKKANITAPQGAPKSVVSISVGAYIEKIHSQFNFDDTLQKADAFLYQAKRTGKDRSVINGQTISDPEEQ